MLCPGCSQEARSHLLESPHTQVRQEEQENSQTDIKQRAFNRWKEEKSPKTTRKKLNKIQKTRDSKEFTYHLPQAETDAQIASEQQPTWKTKYFPISRFLIFIYLFLHCCTTDSISLGHLGQLPQVLRPVPILSPSKQICWVRGRAEKGLRMHKQCSTGGKKPTVLTTDSKYSMMQTPIKKVNFI